MKTTTTQTTGIIAKAAEQKNTPTEVKHKNPMAAMLDNVATKKVLEDALKENAGAFSASILDLYNSDKYLANCNPKQVFGECLKAVSLKLPINKQLGFAYVIAYKGQPQFQIGYKGLIQLCMRTGQYKHINADVVYEGELKGFDKLTGELDLSGERKSDKVIGYFAYIETLNGFTHSKYMTVDAVTVHAKRYSKSFTSGAWSTNFDEMAIKTVLRLLLSHYGYMSVEMMNAFASEETPATVTEANTDNTAPEEIIDAEYTISEDTGEVTTEGNGEEYPFG
jgi:recombination protein RecT